MKKIFSIFLLFSLITYAENLVINGNHKELVFEDGDNIEKIIVNTDSDVSITGKNNGIMTGNLHIGENSTLNIKFQNQEENNKGLIISPDASSPNILNIVEKGATLNIEAYAEKDLESFRSPYGYGYGFGWLEDKLFAGFG